MKYDIQRKCRYCDVELVREQQTYELPKGEKEKKGLSIMNVKVLEAFFCRKCGYTEFFTV